MKPIIKLIVFTFFLNTNLLAQSGWLWQNPQPQGNALGDIHVFDQNTALAVGEAGTVMKTMDGGINWRMQHYAGGTTEYLSSVFFIDANTGWAVGNHGTILKTTNGGSAWSAQTSGTTKALYSVFFVDANTGWAVGGDFLSEGLVLKTTDGGSTWSVQISGTPGELYSVSFINATTGWAVGRRGTILTTTDGGATWSAQNSGTTSFLYSVHFVLQGGINTGWTVGSNGTILKTTNGGTTWSAQISGTTQTLKSIYFVDANTGWVVGGGFFEGIKLKTTDGGITWSVQISRTTGSLASVHFISQGGTNTGWAVGNFGTILKTKNDGSTWSAQSNGTTKNLESVYFVPQGETNTGWTVGAEGTILKTGNGGSTWSAQTSGTTDNLYSVYFVDANTGWTVGNAGTILKTTDGGNSWSAQSSGTTEALNSVFFVDDNTGWAVGGLLNFEGIILKTTNGGSTWSAQRSGTTNQLESVHFTDSNTGWAVGWFGTILKTTDGGSNWSAQTSGTTSLLWSVYFVDANTGWTVGEGGTILKTSNGGNTWSAQTSGKTYSLKSVYFKDANTGWAVGGVGTILKTVNGGNTWSAQTSRTANDLESVGFIPQGGTNTGWAVGIEGTILKTTSGETAILNAAVEEIAIQARSDETATSTFTLSNTGTADLGFNITASGPTGPAPMFSAILKARSAGVTNFSALQPPPFALNKTTGEKPSTSPAPAVQAPAVQAQTRSVTSPTVVGDDVLFLDDGNDTADSFIGLQGTGETYWLNRFVPSGNGFQLERILVFIRTESVSNPSLYVAVTAADGRQLAEDNVTLPSARDGAWYEIGLPASLSFGSGEAFFIILGAPKTIPFPAGVDQDARVPSNSFYLDPGQNRYVPLGTIRGFENGAFLIRAVGTETGDRLTVNPASGTIASGGSQTITVTLNAQGLAAGNYQSQLSITSNGGNHTVLVRVRVSSAVNVAELAYDNGVSTSGYYWSQAGGGSAVRFTPSSRAKLKQAKVFIRNIADGNQFNVRVLAGANGAPGNTIYGPIPVTVPDTGWVACDLSAANLSVSGDFYIMIEYNGTSEPTFGSEKAPPLEKRSWDFDGSEWALFDTEDYLIRAVVEYTTGVAARDDDAGLPQTFALAQNYPNPFSANAAFGNPETTIKYQLPARAQVELAVYDLNGRRVAIVESGMTEAGEHVVRWNGGDGVGNTVSSGVYFYRLLVTPANGRAMTFTKKLTVLK